MEQTKNHASFTIGEDEIIHHVGCHVSKEELAEIFKFIENDELVWTALEESKTSAIRFVLGK